MNKLLAAFCLMCISSTTFAGAAFSETTHCSATEKGSNMEITVHVANSLPDGYSHQVELTINGKTQTIALVEGADNLAMDNYRDIYPLNQGQNRGTFSFESEARVQNSNNSFGKTIVREARLRMGNLDINKRFLCISE